jgi:hypothetical protein
MEKEKNEIESETKGTIDSVPDMKQSDDGKPNSESMKLNTTVKYEDVIDKSEGETEENDVENLSSAAAVEEAVDEVISSTDDDDKDLTVEDHEVAVDVKVQLEQKNAKVQSTKKMSTGSTKLRSDNGGVKNG